MYCWGGHRGFDLCTASRLCQRLRILHFLIPSEHHWSIKRQSSLYSQAITTKNFVFSVLHCWLSDRKGIQPAENSALVCWWWSFVQVPVVTSATPIISRCNKIQNGVTFWYQLTQVVVENGRHSKCVGVWVCVVTTKEKFYILLPLLYCIFYHIWMCQSSLWLLYNINQWLIRLKTISKDIITARELCLTHEVLKLGVVFADGTANKWTKYW